MIFFTSTRKIYFLFKWTSQRPAFPLKITRGVSTVGSKAEYKNFLKVLGLHENCTRDDLKAAFFHLAKKYHPDSKNQEADAEKFQQVENAYRKLQEKFDFEGNLAGSTVGGTKLDDETKNRNDSGKASEFDIDHTAPQHRQYLNYEGIGQGTPFQREKQYQRHQVKKAVENIYNHRVSQIANEEEVSLVVKDVKASKKTKTKYGIDRLVEDLIQESMAKGEFTNLKGSGKPLEYQNHNPFIDVVTHKVNQVLIDNGFSPQWVMLEKEIRTEIVHLKEKLKNGRTLLAGGLPLNKSDKTIWNKHLEVLAEDAKYINKKINYYNLVVPLLHKQLVHVDLKRLSEKCLIEAFSKDFDKKLDCGSTLPSKENPANRVNSDLLSVLYNIFSRTP